MNDYCDLQYTDEHQNCIYYTNSAPQSLLTRTLRKGTYMTLEQDDSNTLFFILGGGIAINIARYTNVTVNAGEFIFAENGNEVLIKATDDTTIVWACMKDQMSLCNEYSFKDLVNYYNEHKRQLGKETAPCILPINHIIRQELECTCETINRGMLCVQYQKLKINILLMLLRAFYSKDDLVRLFRPVLNEDNEFKHAVHAAYNDQINVQELMTALDLSESTFNRKFTKVFGMTAGKYITRRKKDHVLRALLRTDLSVKEISEKFKFTPGYIVKFSKTHFGKTPTELRAERGAE